MLRLELINSAEETSDKERENYMLHGTATDLCLVEPWFNNQSLVVGDSFNAYVLKVEKCRNRGLRFTGFVKNSQSVFPLTHLAEMELQQRDQHVSMTSKSSYGTC